MRSHPGGMIRSRRSVGVGTCCRGSLLLLASDRAAGTSCEISYELVVLRKVDVQLVGEIHEPFRCGSVPNSPQILNDSLQRTSRVDGVLHCLRKLADTPGELRMVGTIDQRLFNTRNVHLIRPDRRRLIAEELLLRDRHRTIRNPMNSNTVIQSLGRMLSGVSLNSKQWVSYTMCPQQISRGIRTTKAYETRESIVSGL